MVRTRTTVALNAGSPPRRMMLPPGGARDVKGVALPQFAAARRRPPAKQCEWCGSESKVSTEKPLRCRRCRRLEETVAVARKFLTSNGLRSLGSSTESDSAEEEQHRTNAHQAQRTLNRVKKIPTKPRPRKKPAAKTAVARKKAKGRKPKQL